MLPEDILEHFTPKILLLGEKAEIVPLRQAELLAAAVGAALTFYHVLTLGAIHRGSSLLVGIRSAKQFVQVFSQFAANCPAELDGGIVIPLFNGIHGLAGDPHGFSQRLLREIPLRSGCFDSCIPRQGYSPLLL